ncbi:MAG: hypothetical protein JWM71_1898 [Solirubrobacteraceae bacterium]|nr:hypothetical protein [Solirubrobacteraceae bacterium]
MRRPWLAVLVVAAVGLVTLAVLAVSVSTTRAFTLGVLSSTPSPEIAAGQTACQMPITVPPGGAFDKVDFEVGTYYEYGPTLDVTVSGAGSRLPGGPRHGVLPKGYPDVGLQQRHVVTVGDVPDGSAVKVCFHNRGPGEIALFGNSDAASLESSALIDGHAIGFDFDLVFRRPARTFATLVPTVARRASLFRPPWMAPGVYYVLALLALLCVPVLLARAVRALAEPDAPRPRS